MILPGPPPRDLENAACKGADPHLFDATEYPDVSDALYYCLRCRVQQSCLEWVSPKKSLFDGVCAGQVWRNGKPENPALFT
jgi:WhiB family redox-sensing transcriptional regulator